MSELDGKRGEKIRGKKEWKEKENNMEKMRWRVEKKKDKKEKERGMKSGEWNWERIRIRNWKNEKKKGWNKRKEKEIEKREVESWNIGEECWMEKRLEVGNWWGMEK